MSLARAMVVVYMDRAQGPTQGLVFTSKPSFVGGTHTSSAKSSGRSYVAAALLGDGPAVWHLATSAEAADRGMAMRLSGEIYSPEAGIQCVVVFEGRGFWPCPRRLTLVGAER